MVYTSTDNLDLADQNQLDTKSDLDLKVAFCVGGLHSEGSGVARIVCDLANALASKGSPVDVYTAKCQEQGATDHMLRAPNRLLTEPGKWMGRLAYSPALRQRFEADMDEIDVVHNHSLWMLPTSYAARVAQRRGVASMFTIHGFLEPWALTRSRWKKRLVGWAFQNRDLRRSTCIHVNSRSELANVRAYGLKNPMAIIPNGIHLSEFENLPDREVFVEQYPELADKKICLFLSRLHEKKGLGHLVEAWGRVANEFSDWQLVVAGPDDGYEEEVKRRVTEFGVEESVTMTGALYGEDKYAALSAADVFALPSFSEGFAMAVLEALACGLPSLITPGCNFPEVVEHGAGVEVTADVKGTEVGLRGLLMRSEAERAVMCDNALSLIRERYTWDRVAESLLEVYRWMQGGGDLPEAVVKA